MTTVVIIALNLENFISKVPGWRWHRNSTGLGLSITKLLVEQMGGSVRAEIEEELPVAL